MLCQDIDVVTFSFFPFFSISVSYDYDGLLITELSTIIYYQFNVMGTDMKLLPKAV